MLTIRQGLSSDGIEQLIAQRVADALTTNEANRNNGTGVNDGTGGSAGGAEHTTCDFSYKEFLIYKPRNFSGTEGVVGLTMWFKKMKFVFHICNCLENYQVKYATRTLLDGVITWWNAYARSVGIDVTYETTWKELKKTMIEE
ncbi:hypothetical protein Tco_1258306 [Tanacetum coccineum]